MGEVVHTAPELYSTEAVPPEVRTALYKAVGGLYVPVGSGCRLVAVPAFKAEWGAIALSLVGSIPTPSANDLTRLLPASFR